MRPSTRTILLVEDEALVAMEQARLLREEGYVVSCVTSGEKAIATVRAQPEAIDLILMDIDLGRGMDGARAAKEILKEHNIPVLFLSAHTEKEVVEKTEKIASYGYVVKDSGGCPGDSICKPREGQDGAWSGCWPKRSTPVWRSMARTGVGCSSHST